jgi:WD40 repeat protein
MFGAAAQPARPSHNPNGDVEVTGPTDSISSVNWSPRANLFVATSWDNNAYCYEVGASGAQGKASTTHTAPIMCSSWHHDGGSVFLGGCDKQVRGGCRRVRHAPTALLSTRRSSRRRRRRRVVPGMHHAMHPAALPSC